MADITTHKKFIEYPIVIFTEEREIRVVNCPVHIVFDEDDTIISVKGYIPEQLHNYIILKRPEYLLIDGRYVKEESYWAEMGISKNCSDAVYEIYNFIEKCHDDYDFEYFVKNAFLDSGLFRRAKQAYDFALKKEPNFDDVIFVCSSSPDYIDNDLSIELSSDQRHFYLSATREGIGSSDDILLEQEFEYMTAVTWDMNFLIHDGRHWEANPQYPTERREGDIIFRHKQSGRVFTLHVVYEASEPNWENLSVLVSNDENNAYVSQPHKLYKNKRDLWLHVEGYVGVVIETAFDTEEITWTNFTHPSERNFRIDPIDPDEPCSGVVNFVHLQSGMVFSIYVEYMGVDYD